MTMISSSTDPVFEAKVIDDELTDGYWIQAVDITGDGRPDLLTSGLASGRINWYRNPAGATGGGAAGPGWDRHLIHQLLRPVSLDAGDIAGAGRTDLVVCHDYARTMFEATPADGTVSWLANPGPGAVEQPWPARFIGQLGSTHRLRLGHFTDTGHLDLLALPVVGSLSGTDALHAPIRIVRYRRPDDVDRAEAWPAETVNDTDFRVIHGAQVGPFGPPSPPGLEASVLASEEGLSWFGVDGSGAWRRTGLGRGEQGQRASSGYAGSANVAIGRLGNDPFAFLAAVEPFHGNTLAVYHRVGGQGLADGVWERQVIETFGELNDHGEGPAHHVVAADLDGDGDDELLVALRGPEPVQGVIYYKPIDVAAGKFERVRVSTPSAARIAVGDFDGDGRLDFATIGYDVPGYFECDHPQVVLFTNRFAAPRRDLPAIPRGPLGG
jgi:hypothetical protein